SPTVSRPSTSSSWSRCPGPVAARPPRRRGVSGRPHARSGRRLRGGSQSRAAHGGHRALRLAAGRRGLREALERHRVLALRPGRRAAAPARAVPRGGPGRPRPGSRASSSRRGRGEPCEGAPSQETRGEPCEGAPSQETRGEPCEGAPLQGAKVMNGRQARIERKTKETEVAVQLNLDGTGSSKIQTPIPFFSHMLEAWAKHGLMDLAVEASGDVEVDIHHT